mgnify:CR=1 FL=1
MAVADVASGDIQTNHLHDASRNVHNARAPLPIELHSASHRRLNDTIVADGEGTLRGIAPRGDHNTSDGCVRECSSKLGRRVHGDCGHCRKG